MRHPQLLITLDKEKIHYLYPLLRQGFMIETTVNCSIRTMLCKGLQISPEYVEERIKTIFLNGKPVDNPDTAIVKDGSILALSGAMPGLVGATFRKGSQLASFRSTITYQKEETDIPSQEGSVILKLFNFLPNELGPQILRYGIGIRGDALETFFQSQSDDFWKGVKGVRLDAKATDPAQLIEKNLFDKEELIFLFVQSDS